MLSFHKNFGFIANSFFFFAFSYQLWLALADRHLHTSGIDWNKEQTKCLSDAWLDDDEELGIQIVKDLHRTGSSLFSGPNGNLNQAKLKSVLLGYARWNPSGWFDLF